jgi:hypothetical protein
MISSEQKYFAILSNQLISDYAKKYIPVTRDVLKDSYKFKLIFLAFFLRSFRTCRLHVSSLDG